MFVNSMLNRFGRLEPKNPTFSDQERLELISKNPFIIPTDVAQRLFDSDHFLFWKKRNSAIWTELHYDDPFLRSCFPTMNQADIHKLTGGPYQLRKAKAYVNDWIEYMKARKNSRSSQSQSQSQSATYATINSKFMNKIITEVGDIITPKIITNPQLNQSQH